MSFIETDGRSVRFLTRAQKCAITSELAPRSSKKWLSTGTCSTPRTRASTSARLRCVSVGGNEHGPVAGGPDQVHGQHLLMVVGHSELLNQVGVVAWLAAKGLWCRHPSRL